MSEDKRKIIKVEDLIAFYKKELFSYLSLEFRDKNNYRIKIVNYSNIRSAIYVCTKIINKLYFGYGNIIRFIQQRKRKK